jgi:hypothetical protein
MLHSKLECSHNSRLTATRKQSPETLNGWDLKGITAMTIGIHSDHPSRFRRHRFLPSRMSHLWTPTGLHFTNGDVKWAEFYLFKTGEIAVLVSLSPFTPDSNISAH